jgi:hypothetical protein
MAPTSSATACHMAEVGLSTSLSSSFCAQRQHETIPKVGNRHFSRGQTQPRSSSASEPSISVLYCTLARQYLTNLKSVQGSQDSRDFNDYNRRVRHMSNTYTHVDVYTQPQVSPHQHQNTKPAHPRASRTDAGLPLDCSLLDSTQTATSNVLTRVRITRCKV